MRNTWTTRVGAIVVALAGTVALALPAQAAAPTDPMLGNEIDMGTAVAPSGGPPADAHCISTTGAKACFVRDGDVIWVQDTAADGHSAISWWRTTATLDGGWKRSGSCVNSSGYGRWVHCNKNFPETDYLWYRARVYDIPTTHFYGISEWQVLRAGI